MTDEEHDEYNRKEDEARRSGFQTADQFRSSATLPQSSSIERIADALETLAGCVATTPQGRTYFRVLRVRTFRHRRKVE